MLPNLIFNKLMVNQTVSANVSPSVYADISDAHSLGLQVTCTGTLVATVNLLASQDTQNFGTLGTVSVATGNSTQLFNIGNVGQISATVSVTYTSGTGTLTVYMSGKQ